MDRYLAWPLINLIASASASILGCSQGSAGSSIKVASMRPRQTHADVVLIKPGARATQIGSVLMTLLILASGADEDANDCRDFNSKDPAGGSWGSQGRVSWTNPSKAYQKQIVNYTDSSGPGIGSCNLYNGQQSTANRTTLNVPVKMQAGLAMSNSDFAGSCGRCYELRCIDGPTMGNHTENGTQTAYPLAIAKPPYENPTFTDQPFLDDRNRTFPGNDGNLTQVVDVKCWKNTTTIIQITDSCDCETETCCTNVNQFNIDYAAFEDLAHPGYGLINVEYRVVNCAAPNEPLPAGTPPAVINTTIFSDHLESGWGINSWAGKDAAGEMISNAITQQLQATVKSHNVTTDAACFTFDLDKANHTDGASTSFACRGSATGLQPFSLSNTAGLQFDIMWAQNVSGSQYAFQRVGFPPVTVALAQEDGTPIATAEHFPNLPNATDSGMTTVVLLYQDSQLNSSLLGQLQAKPDGMQSLEKATALTFAYDKTADPDQAAAMSFCIANLRLLPSTLNNSADLPAIPRGPAGTAPLPNCPFPAPEPVNADDQLVDVGVALANATNFTTEGNAEYTVFEHTDPANQFGIFLVADNDTCSMFSDNKETGLMQSVDTCAKKKDIAGPIPQCCYDAGPNITSEAQKTTGKICDNILFRNESGVYVCNGFSYNRTSGIAFFKAQLVDKSIGNETYCNSPDVVTWMLTTGWMNGNDTRAVAWEARGGTKSVSKWTLSHIWSIAGTVGAVASAVTAVGLWLLLTNSYRLDRQMIITQVSRHVVESDITSAALPHTYEGMDFSRRGSTPNPLLGSTEGSLDPMDSNAGLIDAAIFGVAAGTMSRAGSVGVSEGVRKVAQQITRRCLQRWDAFMGFRPATDSLGRKHGIWRDKFDGVRSATMLLAMRRYNYGLRDNNAGGNPCLPCVAMMHAGYIFVLRMSIRVVAEQYMDLDR